MFLATALINSPLNTKCIPDPKRLMRWEDKAAHPYTYTYADKDRIWTNRHQFFIRKVDVVAEAQLRREVLDVIRATDEVSNELIYVYTDKDVPVPSD